MADPGGSHTILPLMTLDWRPAIVYAHRWLGIACGLLFVAWFASGIVMMYARMPALGSPERLAHLRPLDLASARAPVEEALRLADGPPDRVRIAMWGGRPVYRVSIGGRWNTVFADTGQPLGEATRQHAIDEARRFAPEYADTLTYQTRLRTPDQWTFDHRASMPLHRVALGDPAGTELYISGRTGEPVQLTTRSSRRWGYAGAVVHWVYFTRFRQNGPLWTRFIIWTSIAGVVMCATGLLWGLWQFLRPGPADAKSRRRLGSPYAGWMRWHHVAGLLFGATTLTFVFSGLLSVEPWNWHPGTAPTRLQREAAAGGALRLEGITAERLRAAVHAFGSQVKEAEILQFRGEPFLRSEGRLVSVAAPERGPFGGFDRAALEHVAAAAVTGTSIRDMAWLDRYDAYYYNRHGDLPLPVLRVRFNDPRRTWLYLDPGRGAVVRREERLTRLNRWLYHGLHSWDFPLLYYRRPLWDIVVIVLSIGGLVSSATTIVPAFRRLRRHARRLASSRAAVGPTSHVGRTS